jgi:hypothetical protein
LVFSIEQKLMVKLTRFKQTNLYTETAHSISSSFSCFCCIYKYENVKKLKAWGRSQARHDDGLQKANTTGLLTLKGMTNFRSCHEETRRPQVQILPTPPPPPRASYRPFLRVFSSATPQPQPKNNNHTNRTTRTQTETNPKHQTQQTPQPERSSCAKEPFTSTTRKKHATKAKG